MSFIRSEIKILESRLSEDRRFIQVIAGPRQVGKTTLVHQFLHIYKNKYQFLSADGFANPGNTWIEQQWESVRLRMKTEQLPEFLLVIDEIQKINNWSETVKAEWEKDTRLGMNIKVILLGSSRLLLNKGLNESLAGRFELIHMTHWSFPEMHSAFDISEEEYIWFGGYPGAIALKGDDERWRDYIRHALIETSISKDILLLERVDKPALLKNLFELGCAYSGQILSYNKILGQIQDAGNTTTLSHYLRLLGDAGLLTGLEKFSGERVTQRGSSPKFMVLNTALMSVYNKYSFPDILNKPEAWGRLVESAIGAYFLNLSYKSGMKVYYWRNANYEVDFVLEYKGKVAAIEIKSGVSSNAKGMEIFKKEFHPDKMYVIENSGFSWKDLLKIQITDLF